MPIIPHTTIEAFGAAMLSAAGLPEDQAQIASHHLVEANLMGHDSHGVIRIPGYCASLIKGDAALISASTKRPAPTAAADNRATLSGPKLPRPIVMASA